MSSSGKRPPPGGDAGGHKVPKTGGATIQPPKPVDPTQPSTEGVNVAELRSFIASALSIAINAGSYAIRNKGYGMEEAFTDMFMAYLKHECKKFPNKNGDLEADKLDFDEESKTGADVHLRWTSPKNDQQFHIYLQLKQLYVTYETYCTTTKTKAERDKFDMEDLYFDMLYKSTVNKKYQTMQLQEQEIAQHAMSAYFVFKTKYWKPWPLQEPGYLLPIRAIQDAFKTDGIAKQELTNGDLDAMNGAKLKQIWNSRLAVNPERKGAELAELLKQYLPDKVEIKRGSPVPDRKPLDHKL